MYMTSVEAMASACPVVRAAVTSFPEVVVNDGVQFDSLSAGNIVETVLALLSDSAILGKMWAHGLERAKPFSWDGPVHKALRVYTLMENIR